MQVSLAPLLNIGPHAINTTPNGLDWALVAPVVKGLDNLDVLRAASAQAIRIFRHYDPGRALDDAWGTAHGIIGALQGYTHPLLYVELWNEEHPTPEQVKAVVRILHAFDLKVCGPSWASGNYTRADWLAFRAANWAELDAIAVHGYYARDTGPTQYNALLHRQWYDPLLDRPRFVFLTETGEDTIRDGAHGEYVGKPGWIASDSTIDQCAHGIYVLGHLLFPHEYATFFAVGTNDDFKNFELEHVIPNILDFKGSTSMITAAEFDRLVKNAFDRAQVPHNPDSAFVKYFAAQLRAGHYIGAPEEPEHESEDKSLILQRFASRYLWCRKSDFVVQDGPLPFA